MKNIIKNLLRESLFKARRPVSEINTDEDGEDNDDSKQGNYDNHDVNTIRDYTDVQNALNKTKNPTGPSQVGIMKAMGIEDDEKGVNRSLFGKKLHQDKNDEGGTYQFNDDELATIRGIIPK